MFLTWSGCVHILVFLGVTVLASSYDIVENAHFTVASRHQTIPRNEISSTMSCPTDQECALLCLEDIHCKVFAYDNDHRMCRFSYSYISSFQDDAASSVFEISDISRFLFLMNPPITLNKHDTCGSAVTFKATAFLRLFGNKGMIFTSTNDYLLCQNLNNIAEQGGSQCRAPRPVSGDRGLDPASKYLPLGPIDGAVEILKDDVQDTRYYLFKGENVYCYEADTSNPDSEMRPCVSDDWTVQTIEARFGRGIPSEVDDVMADPDDPFTFYFIKHGLVWKTTGGLYQGEVSGGFPKPVDTVFPRMVRDMTAATVGPSKEQRYYAVDSEVFLDVPGILYDKGLLCHGAR